MRIPLASSEVYPYSKTGGLADMVGALAKSLARGGHEVAVVTPLYRGIKERFPKLQPCDFPLALSLGPATVRGQVWSVEAHERCTIYFVDQPEFFDRPSLYHHEGNDYPDNAARFIFFPKRLPTSRVVCRSVRRSCMHTIGKPASCPCCWRTNDSGPGRKPPAPAPPSIISLTRGFFRRRFTPSAICRGTTPSPMVWSFMEK